MGIDFTIIMLSATSLMTIYQQFRLIEQEKRINKICENCQWLPSNFKNKEKNLNVVIP